jgi:hypothetical protein
VRSPIAITFPRVILSPSPHVILSDAKNISLAQDKLSEESHPITEILRSSFLSRKVSLRMTKEKSLTLSQSKGHPELVER